jgi:predicted GNAT superfamily acetyltransferase
MRRTLEPAGVESSALEAAGAAASAAGVQISSVTDLDEVRAVSALFADIWGTSNGDVQIPKDLLRAMVHAGNYAAAARSRDGLVGAVMGFLGTDDDGVYLHSHILGVSPKQRGSNVGFALKQHQRAWSLARGITRVTWTFDPLVRRNAYFNLQKLGARAAAYHESFYGPMTDGINAGDESDRLLVVWDLEDERTSLAATGKLPLPEPAEDAVVCDTPDDIVALRKSDPDRALEWRRALRGSLGRAMSDGYEVTGFTKSGSYVLRRDGSRT